MTKPPIQATVTISPYNLLRILNLASLHGEFDRLYFDINKESLETYGFKNEFISYCSFGTKHIDNINLARSDPVRVIVDVESWHDTASRLNNSRENPETIREHKFHRSTTKKENKKERRKEFFKQYTDESDYCLIEFHCNRNSELASHRTIIAQNQYEDPLPTPRPRLVHWEQVHNIMATYGIDSIIVGKYKIKNKFSRDIKGTGLTSTQIFPTPKNEQDYRNYDLFSSDRVTPEEITKSLWSEIKTKVRRGSPQWILKNISIPDSEISFKTSKLNKITNLFDSNNRFRNPSTLNCVPSSFKTNVETLEVLVEDYDLCFGPPYPVELREGEFIVDPKYAGYSGSKLYSIDASGPAFRKEVVSLDSIADSLSDNVLLESGPHIPHLAVIKPSDRMILRYVMPDVKYSQKS